MKKTLLAVCVGAVTRSVVVHGLGETLHNVVGHPLLSLADPLGERVHQATLPGNRPWQHWTEPGDEF